MSRETGTFFTPLGASSNLLELCLKKRLAREAGRGVSKMMFLIQERGSKTDQVAEIPEFYERGTTVGRAQSARFSPTTSLSKLGRHRSGNRYCSYSGMHPEQHM